MAGLGKPVGDMDVMLKGVLERGPGPAPSRDFENQQRSFRTVAADAVTTQDSAEPGKRRQLHDRLPGWCNF